jgi:hypothetical protein
MDFVTLQFIVVCALFILCTPHPESATKDWEELGKHVFTTETKITQQTQYITYSQSSSC